MSMQQLYDDLISTRKLVQSCDYNIARHEALSSMHRHSLRRSPLLPYYVGYVPDFSRTFYDAAIAIAILSVCLSVRPSFTFVDDVKTVRDTNMSSYDTEF